MDIGTDTKTKKQVNQSETKTEKQVNQSETKTNTMTERRKDREG